MKIKDLDDSKNYLNFVDFENFFQIYKDKRQNYVYNLNKSLYIDIDDNVLESYQISHDMFWPLVSYKLYGTTHLAWLLMKVNKIDAKSIFNKLHAGDIVKYLSKEYVTGIVEIVNEDNDI